MGSALVKPDAFRNGRHPTGPVGASLKQRQDDGEGTVCIKGTALVLVLLSHPDGRIIGPFHLDDGNRADKRITRSHLVFHLEMDAGKRPDPAGMGVEQGRQTLKSGQQEHREEQWQPCARDIHVQYIILSLTQRQEKNRDRRRG